MNSSSKHSPLKRLLQTLSVAGVFILMAFSLGDGFESEYAFINALNDQLTIQSTNAPEDRVYLQFDKTMYLPGDDIWFSVYLLNGQDFKASERSDVLHAELIAPNGTAIKKVKITTKNGRATGDFKLDEDAPGGAYKVKAYTNWQHYESSPLLFEKALHVQDVNLPDLKMKMDFDRKGYSSGEDVQLRLVLLTNHAGPLAGHEYNVAVKLKNEVVYKQKGVTGATGKASIEFTLPKDAKVEDGIVNAEIEYRGFTESISRSIPFHKNNISLKMYPEGGDLVAGLPGRVAFQASDDKGKPSDISGRLVNAETKEIISEFKSFHHGMGDFTLTPEEGVRYYVEITKPSTVKQTFPLPNTSNKNMVMKVTSVEPKRVKVKIHSKVAEPAYVVFTMREKLYWADSLDLEIGSNYLTIPTYDAPIGVARVTVFNRYELPVAERVVFANRDKQMQIKVETDKEVYLPREKVTAKVSVTDEKGNPVAASLSMSVVDDKLLAFADDRSAHLLSKMLLEYDLHRKVEEPQIYFRRDKKSLKKLEYLMLTAGWRRFEWTNIKNYVPSISSYANGELTDQDAIAKLQKKLAENRKLITASHKAETARQQLVQKKNVQPQPNAQLVDWLGVNQNNLNNAIVLNEWNNNDLNQLNLNNIRINNNVNLNNVNFLNGPNAFVGQQHIAAPVIPQGNMAFYNSGSNCHFVAANYVGMETLSSQQFVFTQGSAIAPKGEPAAEDAFVMGHVSNSRRGRSNEVVAANMNNGRRAQLPRHVQEIAMEAREFEAPEYSEAQTKSSSSADRTDFRSTVYWNGELNVDESGTAEISFYNNDDISSFRITTEGVSSDGMLGRSTSLFATNIPLSVNTRLPKQVIVGDTISLPVVLSNNTKASLVGELEVKVPKAFRLLKQVEEKQCLDVDEVNVVYLKMVALKPYDASKIKIAFSSADYSDAIEEQITIQPKGIPANQTFNGNDLKASYRLDLDAVEKGSMKTKITLYPSVMADIVTGVESILREPHGCFEQTSSSSYPNILVLQYLQETETDDPKVRARAEELISKGYKRLTTFETSSNGYDWFGRAPGHEGLTAYGLMQFQDMRSVSNEVDETMMRRTRNWLYSKRDGKGGFKRRAHASHNFGRISEDVMNGYIVYAMTEAGETGILREAKSSWETAVKNKDPYLLAMSAISMHNLGQTAEANEAMELLLARQGSDGHFAGTTHSITYSTGKSLEMETTSIAAMALMKTNADPMALNKAIEYITSNRSGRGGFGSTQATILSLKALSAYSSYSKQITNSGRVAVYVDGIKRSNVSFKKGDREAIEIGGLDKHITPTSNIIVKFDDTDTPLPYTISVDYTTTATPENSNLCKVRVKSRLLDKEAKIGSTVRLTTTVHNTTRDGLPSTMCLIGIPGGCSVQPWQLKELMEDETVDYYELRDNQLICYFRGMSPGERRVINLDLKTEVSGSYEIPPSSAYLYYTNEHKAWADGLSVRIKS